MADLAAGVVLGGRFEIAGVLGRGGMATVYLARDRVRDERVALKVLHPHVAGQPAGRARLKRELAAAQRIRHPRALVASELFELDGLLALSMPLHPGQTLAEDVETRGPMDAEQLWRLGAALAGALAEAHRAGVVHRDLSPGNVLIDQAREGMLTDFGLARLDDAHSRTATTALGTAGFTAPEVLDGGRAEPRSDLYGLGCVLYLAATGKAPFQAPSPLATMKRQGEGSFVPLATARPELPPHLRDQIEGLLAVDPAARPESAREVAEAMGRREAAQTKTSSKTKTSPPTESSSAPPPLVHAKLPVGPAWVELIEPQERRHRRRDRQRHLKRQRQAGLEGLVEGLALKVEPAVRSWLGLPQGREPEELLRDAVAEQAGLPAEALTVASAMEATRFRLVDGVSRDVAERLAEQARTLGYRARVREGEGAARGRVWAGLAVGALLMHALAGAGALGIGIGLLPFDFELGVMAAFLLAVLVSGLAVVGRVSAAARPALPRAYTADLRPHLTPEYARRLSVLVAPPPLAGAPAAASPADPLAPLLLSLGARLAALEAAIQSSAARLPAAAVEDLQETLGELRARARAVELQLRALSDALAARDPAAEEQAAARVQARLERLQARARGGEPVDPAELGALERSLAAHQAQQEAHEEDEQRLVRLQAALLEIGAAAEAARRTLLESAAPARSVEDLLGRLKAESAQARAAEDEVADARRRAAAQQRAAHHR